jgi:transposase
MRNRLYKQGKNRSEEAALPQRIEDFVSSDNPVRAIEAFVETLNLAKLGFENTEPNKTAAGQPAFSPAYLLMLYLYGYINRIRSFFNGNVSNASFHSVKRLTEDIEKLKAPRMAECAR